MAQSTRSTTTLKEKPKKPHPDFPLFPHAVGLWAKKVRKKLHYFGPWSDPEAALKKWLDEKDDLLAGRKPRAKGDAAGPTVASLVNQFLTAKKALVDSGELTARSHADYYRTCEIVVKTFGAERVLTDLEPIDFAELRGKLAGGALVTLTNEITRVKVLFNYAVKNSIVDAIKFGTSFDKPSQKALRKVKNEREVRMFTRDEVLKLIYGADAQVKAMIFLGINCGFGNSDVATLKLRGVDLEGGWINHPRPKTGEARRCKLWPETVAALTASLLKRPMPKCEEAETLFFVTKYGFPWVRSVQKPDKVKVKVTVVDGVSQQFKKLAAEVGTSTHFYDLRRTYRTVADASLDERAIMRTMGHVPPGHDMGAKYLQFIADARLEAVANHVRTWLFPPKAMKAKPR